MSAHRRIDRSQSSNTLSQTCKSRELVETHKLDEEFVQNLEEVEQRLEQFSKHERIRIEGWMKKLCEVISNPVWKQNRNFYIELLLEMLRYKMVCAPFTHLPPDGPLPRLSKTDIILPWQKLPLSASKSTVLSTNSDICNIAWKLPLHHKEMSCTESESLAKQAFLKSCSQEELTSLRYEAGGRDTENVDPRCLPPVTESMAFIATEESEGECKSSSVNVREIVSLKQRLEECEEEVRRVLAEKEECQQQLEQLEEIASLNTERQEEEELNSEELVEFVQRSVKLVYENYDRLYGQIESIFLVKEAENLAQKMNFELPIDYVNQENKEQKSQSEQIEEHFKYHSRELHDKFNKTAEETEQFKNFLENVQENVNECRENSNKSEEALQEPSTKVATEIKRPPHLRLLK